jgi:hypothetical protein
MLDRVQDIPELKGQIAKLREIAALIQKRIAATDDITRKLRLGDDLVAVRRQIRGDQATIAANAVQAAEDARQRRAEALQRAQEAAQKAAARVAARQFRALGFGPEGGDLIPGVGNLRKRLQSLRASLAGTSLDTRATQQMIRHIGTVLSGAFGTVGEQVRSKIDEIFKSWSDELKKGRDDLATSFRPVDANKFIAGLGLGLTPDQVKRLRAGIVTLGPHATAPTQHTGAFALAGGGTTIHIEHFHSSAPNAKQLEAELQKRAHGRPHPRRGAQ